MMFYQFDPDYHAKLFFLHYLQLGYSSVNITKLDHLLANNKIQSLLLRSSVEMGFEAAQMQLLLCLTRWVPWEEW